MIKGKLKSVRGMELSSGEVIPELETNKGYKYLGIFDNSHKNERQDPKEVLQESRQLTSSKLNCWKYS